MNIQMSFKVIYSKKYFSIFLIFIFCFLRQGLHFLDYNSIIFFANFHFQALLYTTPYSLSNSWLPFSLTVEICLHITIYIYIYIYVCKTHTNSHTYNTHTYVCELNIQIMCTFNFTWVHV